MSVLFWRLRVLLFYFVLSLISIIAFVILSIMYFSSAKYETKYIIAKLYGTFFIKSLEYICDIRYEVEGDDNVPNFPCVIALNHQSFWDNIIVILLFPMQSWVVKKELYNIPFFGWGLRMMNPIAVNRRDNLSVTQILKMGKKKIDQNLNVIIFPEGTRLNYGVDRNLKPSFAKLAIMSEVPVLPVVHNAGLCWPKGFWMTRSGVIKVRIGNLIKITVDDDPREITNITQEWINTNKALLTDV